MASLKPTGDTKSPPKVAKYLKLYDLERPTSQADIETLVVEHGLSHGDVVAFDEYRDTDSYIVSCLKDGTATLVDGSDDSGYLTIPKEVLVSIHDSVTFYQEIIAERPGVTLHPSPQDKFVVNLLGHVPSDWQFSVDYEWGEMGTFCIKVPGYEWDCFDPNTVSREVIEKRYFSGSPLVSVCVRIELHGTEYHKYMSKHGWDDSPSIPVGWLRKSYGSGSGGPEHRIWGWKFTGPQTGEEEVRKNIMDFLKGFTYHFE